MCGFEHAEASRALQTEDRYAVHELCERFELAPLELRLVDDEAHALRYESAHCVDAAANRYQPRGPVLHEDELDERDERHTRFADALRTDGHFAIVIADLSLGVAGYMLVPAAQRAQSLKRTARGRVEPVIQLHGRDEVLARMLAAVERNRVVREERHSSARAKTRGQRRLALAASTEKHDRRAGVRNSRAMDRQLPLQMTEQEVRAAAPNLLDFGRIDAGLADEPRCAPVATAREPCKPYPFRHDLVADAADTECDLAVLGVLGEPTHRAHRAGSPRSARNDSTVIAGHTSPQASLSKGRAASAANAC